MSSKLIVNDGAQYLTYFRERLNKQAINQINEWIALGKRSQAQDDHDDDEPGQSTTKH